MDAPAVSSTGSPVLSIVIAVYNDWRLLDKCLRSLAKQSSCPSFEVVVVDDGSEELVPGFVLGWKTFYPLTILRQCHAGIAVARNVGVRASRGPVLVFVDADSQLEATCLAALDEAVSNHPDQTSFQLRLTANRTTFSERVEALRLITLQEHLLQPNGCIRYLNTAGFAIRRRNSDVERGLFDTSAQRGEDTLLLVNLIQGGELPLFVTGAVVQHSMPLEYLRSVLKYMRSAYLEASTYEFIASKGFRIRITNRTRLRMLLSMWSATRRQSLGISAWLGLVIRQTLLRTVSFLYKCGLLPQRTNTEPTLLLRRAQDATDA